MAVFRMGIPNPLLPENRAATADTVRAVRDLESPLGRRLIAVSFRWSGRIHRRLLSGRFVCRADTSS